MATVYPLRQVFLLEPLIDDINASQRAIRDAQKPGSIHSSGITSCLRQLVYDHMGLDGVAETADPSWTRDAQAGTDMHEYYQSLVDDAGLVPETDDVIHRIGWQDREWEERFLPLPEKAMELPLPRNPYRVGGRIDTVMDVPEEYAELADLQPGLCILEIKTVKSKYFKQGLKSVKFESYTAQATLYMHFTGIRQAVIWVIDRDTSKTHEYAFEYDQERAEELLHRAEAIDLHLEHGTIPHPEYRRIGKSFLCSYCRHQTRCLGEI